MTHIDVRNISQGVARAQHILPVLTAGRSRYSQTADRINLVIVLVAMKGVEMRACRARRWLWRRGKLVTQV